MSQKETAGCCPAAYSRPIEPVDYQVNMVVKIRAWLFTLLLAAPVVPVMKLKSP
jgi:hypothetical protein